MKKLIYFSLIATATVFILPSPERLMERLDAQLPSVQSQAKPVKTDLSLSDRSVSEMDSARPETFSDWVKTPQAQALIASGAIDQALMIARTHEIHERECTWADAGEVEAPNTTEVYQWRDEQGRVFFGDRDHARKHAATARAKTTHYAGQKQFFNINIHGQVQWPESHFKETLTGRINKVYEILSDQNRAARTRLGIDDTDPKVELNLWLFGSHQEYVAFQKQELPVSNSHSLGFHYAPKNIAATWVKTAKQGMTTSVHEAVHVMNNGLYGWLERWLNEGIAEYFQDIAVMGQAAHIPVKTAELHWLKQQKATLTLSELNELNRTDWVADQERISKLYSHSWLAVHFLMDEPDLKQALFDFLIQSSQHPCQEAKALAAIAQQVPGGFTTLDQRFSIWLEGVIDGHAY